jgi:gamma-glutamylcyclotransferase (GGCT)/AIG2-like uncharacterized protein YtfP
MEQENISGEDVRLAVNGTLMRGLELNHNLTGLGAAFVRETRTEACYRLWSVDDRHPAMLRDEEKGRAISVEIWRVPGQRIAELLANEPVGLCLGRIRLGDGGEAFGILAEPHLCEGRDEITKYGGWREYMTGRDGIY